MFDTQSIPDFYHSITFDNGICAEFNDDSTINFYGSDDEHLMELDPSDLTMLHAAYRAMVKERLEDKYWGGE